MPYDKTAILNAINGADSMMDSEKRDIRTIVEAIIGEPLVEPLILRSIGDRFTNENGDEYLLAAVGTNGAVELIGVENGIRYRNAFEVKDYRAITPEEMKAIGGDRFTKI